MNRLKVVLCISALNGCQIGHASTGFLDIDCDQDMIRRQSISDLSNFESFLSLTLKDYKEWNLKNFNI